MMFDTTSNRVSNSINAVSGTLVKSHPKSYLRWGTIDSGVTSSMMGRETQYVVLQAMLVGDKCLMYEVVDRKDYR